MTTFITPAGLKRDTQELSESHNFSELSKFFDHLKSNLKPTTHVETCVYSHTISTLFRKHNIVDREDIHFHGPLRLKEIYLQFVNAIKNRFEGRYSEYFMPREFCVLAHRFELIYAQEEHPADLIHTTCKFIQVLAWKDRATIQAKETAASFAATAKK